MIALPDKFIRFKESIQKTPLPERFTFPFYYQPHPLSIKAANQLQSYLESQQDFKHNFGLNDAETGLVIGKMFGVLVVQHKGGEMGFLAAFSGKLANSNHHDYFVPPVFDILTETGFFKKEEAILNALNAQIDAILSSEQYLVSIENLSAQQAQAEIELEALKSQIKIAKQKRKAIRSEAVAAQTPPADLQALLNNLAKESADEQYKLKRLKRSWDEQISTCKNHLDAVEEEINRLKTERAERSNQLQQQLFDQYQFLNANMERESLLRIFENFSQQIPPAGAGECAAPKLLHYAYSHGLKPITMAEFWWGASPKSEVRKHGQFYPACRSKCEPILGFMMKGLEVEHNPMLENPAEGKELTIIFEDAFMMAINKPHEFLSVPGKQILDSVYTRIKEQYPHFTGPLLVHRLDMSTSGVLIIAKTKDVHQKLQRQFLNRSVKKRYIALLDGNLSSLSGVIDLPLRVDLDNRPQQLVCYEYGKRAITKWELIEQTADHARVYFYPITGRTHQLRVHAAHTSGLNRPIKGDDIYGIVRDRLYLHAEQITLRHPVQKNEITITAPCPF
jgi:tRNA pseudouridine32 synthase/23S rRNA pseudouridine746 synthase